ncbi:DUF2512 family protein [Alicyclobacillus sp.]|uniref:DUF2512 family protein n=1 Tax=Alicyclobacillus sp. TaxID=61169 RepID=UPI0025B7B0A8|nr:DUF2512 family protein [Alicyclobacillus sp.]MCL6516254.1 DUF2512 family protein [Alicyclobacillus sp.]
MTAHRARLAEVSLRNAIAKLVLFSLVLSAARVLWPDLYPSAWPLVLTVLVLTVTGVIGDATLVVRYGNVPPLLIGFFGMTAILWGVARLWPATHMTLERAVTVTLALGVVEFFLHRYVLSAIRTPAR